MTPPRSTLQALTVRTPVLLLTLAITPRIAASQAPQAADLWRVATASLARPPALQTGPTGSFWNPAAAPDAVTIGLQLIQTPDVLGLSGVIAGATYPIGGVRVGITIARMDVRDLVRTTTSPNSQSGRIPIYAQMAGVLVQFSTGIVQAGGHFRVHDSRFDTIPDAGATVDFGVGVTPINRLRLSAATHFFPIDLTSQGAAEYYSAVSYEVWPSTSIAGASTSVVARYGTTYRSSGDLDHWFSAGISVGGHFQLDGSITRETAFGGADWRPSIRVALSVGRYHLSAARSEGLNDIGATYRFGLDVVLSR